MKELYRLHPDLWRMDRVDRLGELVTTISAELILIDGIREETFCEIVEEGEQSTADHWNVRIGVDFVSGGSNTVNIHIQQCIQYVRNQLGYKVKKGEKIVTIPSQKVRDEIAQSQIPAVLDPDLQSQLLAAHKEVNIDGKCPTDIQAYAILLDVWQQVKALPMDLPLLNENLNANLNGGRLVQSCAFSREWNERYSEDASLECNVDEGFCRYEQTDDGTTRWQFNAETGLFEFHPLSFLGLHFGGRSIHEKGTMLDLKLIRLSKSLWLEAYLDLDGKPVSLGLVTVPEAIHNKI